MDLVGDRRAQSVQIGAVLLFAVLIIAFSSYQAFVVPEQNREVEFNHNQNVHTQIQELRNAIVSIPGATTSQAVAVQLGTQYPSRALARNPGPPTGSLRTNGTADSAHNITVRNAVAGGETGDYWTGTQPRTYPTGTLIYTPNYNVYTQAPTTYYEHSVAYNQFRSGTVTLSGQALVDGRDISLVALNGSLDRTAGGSTAIDVRPVSRSDRTVSVTDDGTNNVSLSFLSRLPATTWNQTLSTEIDPTPGSGDDERYVADVSDQPGPGPFFNVTLTFERGVDYDLRLAKAGVGTEVTETDSAYLTAVDGDDTNLTRGDTTDLVVEVRDAYNNPVSGVPVNATVLGTNNGTLAQTRVEAGDDGRTTFTYESSTSNDTGRHEIQFTLGPNGQLGSGFDGATALNVTLNVTLESEPTTPPSTGGGRLVTLEDGLAFDADGDGTTGGFNVTVENRVGQLVNITDVGILPENGLIDGINGTPVLTVEAASGDTRAVGIQTDPGQYGYIDARWLVLSLESVREERVYSVDGGGNKVFAGRDTTLSGPSIQLGDDELAELTFREFYDNDAQFNVSNESFRVGVTYSADGGRVTDESVVKVEPPSATVGNTAPTADISAPSSATVGEPVTYDASGSSDIDGDTLSYSWDTDDDGTYGDATGATYATSYSTTGDKTVSVRVSDGNGGTDVESQTVSISTATGSVSYNDDGLAFDDDSSPTVREGALFSVTNNYGAAVTVTSVTVDPQNNSIDYIDDGGRTGQDLAENDTELSIRTASQSGYKDITAGAAIPDGGLSIDLAGSNSQQAEIAAGDSADVYFYRFLDSDGGTELDVTCEQFDVTVSFASQPDETYTVTAGPATGDCGGFSSVGVTDMVPQTSGQGQLLTFTPDSDIPGDETVTLDLSGPQQTSPLQVDYEGNGAVASYNVGQSGSFTTLTTDDAEITWEAASSGLTAGTQVRINVTGVETGAASGPYTVGLTRDNNGVSTTTSFEVATSNGSPELTNLSVSDLVPGTTDQRQTIQFEPTTDLVAGDVVSVSLADPQGGTDVDYSNPGTLSVDQPQSNLAFRDQSSATPSIQYVVGSGGITAGTTTTISISAVDTGAMSNAPYTVAFSRGDADTASTTFTAANDPSAIRFTTPPNSMVVNVTTNEVSIGQIQVQDNDSDSDLDRIRYVVTDSSGTEVYNDTTTGIGPGQYQRSSVTLSASSITAGETYTLTATVFDADGNFDSASTSDTADSVTINSATSAGGNNIDVEFTVSPANTSNTVTVQALRNGNVRDEQTGVAVTSGQPQTVTISGGNQADQVRVIVFSASGTEQARTTATYPTP